MSTWYYLSQKILGEDPAALLRKVERRHKFLCCKGDLSVEERKEKEELEDLMQLLARVVRRNMKKVN